MPLAACDSYSQISSLVQNIMIFFKSCNYEGPSVDILVVDQRLLDIHQSWRAVSHSRRTILQSWRAVLQKHSEICTYHYMALRHEILNFAAAAAV